MRRMWMGQLVLLLGISALIGTSRFARAADLPFAGNWKVTFLFQNVGPMGLQLLEVNGWLVKVDKEGKKIEVLSTHPAFKGGKPAKEKVTAGSLHFLLKGPGNNEYEFAFYLPKGKEKSNSLLGMVRLPTGIVPARFDKTELTEIDAKSSVQLTGGMADLKAALETKEADDRFKDLEDVVKTYEGKMVAFYASQVMLQELILKKAEAAAFKPVAEAYLKTAALYGREMEIQANRNLCRQLIGSDKTSALVLTYAQQAAKLLKKDDYRGTRLETWINLANALHKNNKDEDVKEPLKNILAITEDVIEHPRIPAPKLLTTFQMARVLLGSSAPAVADAGLAYARKAEKLLTDESPLNDQVGVLTLLHNALTQRGTALKDEKLIGEAKAIVPRIVKIENQLDKEYLKKAISFKTEKFAGRKGKSDRAVVVELFTCTQFPGVAAAQVGVDALDRTWSPKEVVLLEYHIHFQQGGNLIGPDPLANQDTEARAKFYADDMEGPPAVFVDGKPTADKPGGAISHAKTRYEAFRAMIDKALETNSEAKIKLDVKLDGNKINLSADVSDLKETGDKVKLHILLVEDSMRYVGNSGVRLHHHVVRAIPSGAGFKLGTKDSAHKATIDLKLLRKKLEAYLNAVVKKAAFPNRTVPLELKKFKVVALIQDDDSKKIFQSVQVDVPEVKEAKEEKKDEKKDEKEKKEKE